MSTERFQIPCAHLTDNIPTSQKVPDYHPLSMDELKELITIAFNDKSKANDIQCRLVQAIPGHMCPHLIEGPVAKKQNKLEETYVDALGNGGGDDLVNTIAKILEIHP